MSLAKPVVEPDHPGVGRWERLLPGPADLVFGLVLFSVLAGGRFRLLNDPGTFWHVRLGRDILARGAVPHADTLTFTHLGARWVDQSWLYDLGLAAIVNIGGLSLACGITALLLAGLYSAVTQGLIADGRGPLVALVVGILAAGVGATHFLARPHVLTLILVWVVTRICQRYHESGGWILALAPALTALWANLHGGFLAGPILLATAAIGQAVSDPADPTSRKRVGGFVLAFLASLAAALATPYGVELYHHVAGLLYQSGVTELIQEYQPIPFGKGDARVVELVILGLIGLPMVAGARMSRYELTHTLVWLHLALASIRHAPIFALVAAPGLARMLDGLISQPTRTAATSPQPSWSIWPVAAALILGAAGLAGATYGRLDPGTWPVAAVDSVNQAGPARLFHEQDWGGLVEAELQPPRLAFIDDRFEIFGRDEVLAYLNALEGGPDWDRIRDRDQIGLAWVRADRGLARRLEREPGWRALHRDAVSVLFGRVSQTHAEGTVAGR